MSKADDNFDLFSYFNGDFSEPSTPKEEALMTIQAADTATATANSPDPASSTNSEECAEKGENIVCLASTRLREQRQQERTKDACEDECQDRDIQDEECEDYEALAKDAEPDDAAADKAELAGGQANAEVKANQKMVANTGAATAKKEEKKPEFNYATYIAYAGNSFLLTKFFEVEKLAELDLETVRKRLERDFPELSKQRCKMEWDEKKNLIIPMVTGGKKGSFFTRGLKGFFFSSKDLIEHQEPINILAAQDGYYELRGVRRS